MRVTPVKERKLARAFNRNVSTLDASLEEFLGSGDSHTTAALRKATRRLRTSYSVLPKRVRRDPSVKRYVAAARRLSKDAGSVRDLDTIAAWTMQISEGKDKRSLISDLDRLRGSNLRKALLKARELEKLKSPSLDPKDIDEVEEGKRAEKVERRLSKRADKEFEEFLDSQEVDVMHALRKDSKRLRHLLELIGKGDAPQFLNRLKSIQDDLGAIRDHDLVIDYLRSRPKLTSTRSLIREEIAKRHSRLEDFVARNRGQGHLVPISSHRMA